jgi:hypothetical protein
MNRHGGDGICCCTECNEALKLGGATFETSEGAEAAKVGSGEWVQLEGMKLGHGCCDCSLWHQVQFRIVDSMGLEQDEADLHIQMKWVRDQEETVRLREHQKNTSTRTVSFVSQMPEVLFDGFAVLNEARAKGSNVPAHYVADVLDAVVRLLKKERSQ